MAMRSRPTMLKRQRERNRMEKQKQKKAMRLERSQRPVEKPDVETGEDPDIAGMVAGPQPLAEWQIDEAEAKKNENESEEGEASEAAEDSTE